MPAVTRSRHDLPRQLSSFVGREQAIEELRGLVFSARLLTLTGPGGIGKTRLATEVARNLASELADEVCLVELASLADARLIPQAIAAIVDVREQPGRALLTTLAEGLGSRPLLLVLDNCEHLVQACAVLAHEMLTACPNLRILATSREALRIDGETVWRVPSLELPGSSTGVEEVASSEAVRLFVDRARALLPTFELDEDNCEAIAGVCRRLDGIPLALELAAARASLLSIDEIAARLDDALGLLVAGRRLAPARHQTVRATLNWSYALLTEPERVLFERLSVFAGGWTVDAAEAVAAGDPLDAGQVLELLGRLVDTSMVVVDREAGHVRYRLLDVVRQYGREQLVARGSADAIHRQHAAYFLTFAEQIEPDLSSPRVKAAQARLEADYDNLRMALGWLLDRSDVDGAQRLAGALGRFWFFRGHLAEADTWLNRALTLPGGDQPTLGRAKCLFGLSVLNMGRGDYAAVEHVAQEARALFHAVGNTVQEAFSLFHLGEASIRLGKHAEARAYLEAGLVLSRGARHGGAEANCLFTLAELAIDLGHIDEARGWADAALARATDIGQARQIAAANGFLGVLSTRQGDYVDAAVRLEESLATWRELGETWWVAEALVRLGQLAIEQGEIAIARMRLTEGVRQAEQLGDRHRIAAGLESFVQLAVLEGRARLALQLAAAAEAVRESISVPPPPAERSHLESYLAQAQRTLGGRAADRATLEGRAMGMRQAVDLAVTGTELPTVDRTAKQGRSILTAREQAVACLVAQGLTNRQIAERLVVAEGTAERHVANILGKLEMNARSQIAAWAVRHGLLSPEIHTDV